MRIACVEQQANLSRQDVRGWEVNCATGKLLPEAVCEWVRRAADQLEHQLVRLASGRARCKRCGITLSDQLARRWLTEPCRGARGQKVNEHLNERSTVLFQGTFNDFLQE